MKFTNEHNISLPMAVWLLHDTYDYNSDPKYISATTLLKPIKEIVLRHRVPKSTKEMDLSDLIASRLGTAIHDSIEKAWSENHERALNVLGYTKEFAQRVLVNPTPEQLKKDKGAIPVYIEQRQIREFNGWKIGGKFDIVIDGRLFDVKSTSVWALLKGDKDTKYSQQGSIYRWLNPSVITSDHVYIQFLFTDWQRFQSKINPQYPKTRAVEHRVALMSLKKTEEMIVEKLNQIEEFWDEDEEYIPECTPEELWMKPSEYKYYSDPTKLDGKATKVFGTDKNAADAYLASKGGKGVIKEIKGEAKACEYCSVFDICKQKDRYFNV